MFEKLQNIAVQTMPLTMDIAHPDLSRLKMGSIRFGLLGIWKQSMPDPSLLLDNVEYILTWITLEDYSCQESGSPCWFICGNKLHALLGEGNEEVEEDEEGEEGVLHPHRLAPPVSAE